MPVERRGQVTHVRMESTGNRRNSLSWRKPAGFLLGWHEPDELRGSCPDLWGTRGEIPRVYPANPSRVAGREKSRFCKARHIVVLRFGVHHRVLELRDLP